MEKHKNFIGGEWRDPLTDEWLENVDPANGEQIGLFPRSGADDVELATAAARKALGDWRNLPGPARAEFLLKTADCLKVDMGRYAEELCREMGKPIAECVADIQEAVDMALFCAGEGRRNLGMVTSSDQANRTVMAFRTPIGVAGAITPWNYPMAMPAWKVMPALVTGNTVVLKPAEDTPHSAVNLVRAF
ncbi:MAG: aldehyde dehydrogenase family protein, partial [Proteobacteria bacterium]|nr:aldehyde dehydrogenase family protein [Pseudomonadota bacterium]